MTFRHDNRILARDIQLIFDVAVGGGSVTQCKRAPVGVMYSACLLLLSVFAPLHLYC